MSKTVIASWIVVSAVDRGKLAWIIACRGLVGHIARKSTFEVLP